jgi:hypothetical protein
MTGSRVAGRTIRQKKLSTKQNLGIIREEDFEASYDDESQRNIPKVETGVEKAEEIVSLIPFSSSKLDLFAIRSGKLGLPPLSQFPNRVIMITDWC